MAIVFTVEGVRAILATRKKERIMIEEGGKALPVSSYVFLCIRYVLRVLMAMLAVWFMPALPINMWVLLVVICIAIVFVSQVIEVAIRTLIVMYLTRKYRKAIEKKVCKKETV